MDMLTSEEIAAVGCEFRAAVLRTTAALHALLDAHRKGNPEYATPPAR